MSDGDWTATLYKKINAGIWGYMGVLDRVVSMITESHNAQESMSESELQLETKLATAQNMSFFI